jgi:hypothetical protein
VLGDGERQSRGQHPLDDRIRCGVDEQRQVAGFRPFLEDVTSRIGICVSHAHGCEDDLERTVRDPGLGGDLSGQLEVRQAAD